MKYEVTIPFSRPPWYTGIAIAETPFKAIDIVKRQAAAFGFVGKHKKVQFKELEG